MLENFLKRREKLNVWFKDLDPADDKISHVIDDGVVLVLPGRDSESRKVFVFNVGKCR